MIVDHYFCGTAKNGKLKIDGLPQRDYEFWFWHERAGWLEKKYNVEIKAGEQTPATLWYTADRFEEEK